MAKKPKECTWRITEVRAKGRYLGTVKAATLEQALQVAAEYFGIDGHRAKRLIAQREGQIDLVLPVRSGAEK